MRNSNESSHEVLTAREVAEILRSCNEYVLRLIRRGELPSFQVGRYHRIRRADLDAWLIERSRRDG